MKLLKIRLLLAGLTLFVVLLQGCSDWQTTPVTVDEYHGVAVREMIKNQTLYPEHTQTIQEVTVFDGRKGQQVIRAYRAPATDLRQGKKSVEFNSQIGRDK